MARKKTTLLASLAQTIENSSSVNSELIRQIPLSQLIENPLNRFSMKEDEAFERSLHSIEQDGLFEELIVTPAEDGTYRIISGHRRAAIARKLGKTQIPCKVRRYETELDEIRALIGANIHKREITPLDMARQLQTLSDVLDRQVGVCSMRQRLSQLSEQTGLSIRTLEKYFDLLNLKEPFSQWLEEGALSLKDAYTLGQKKNLPVQEKILSCMEQIDEALPLPERIRIAMASAENIPADAPTESAPVSFEPPVKEAVQRDLYKTVSKYSKNAKKMLSEFTILSESPTEKTDALSQKLDEFQSELRDLLSACENLRKQWKQ